LTLQKGKNQMFQVGLEPTTFGSGGRRSVQLSYGNWFLYLSKGIEGGGIEQDGLKFIHLPPQWGLGFGQTKQKKNWFVGVSVPNNFLYSNITGAGASGALGWPDRGWMGRLQWARINRFS
jgi:hypothetical protein